MQTVEYGTAKQWRKEEEMAPNIDDENWSVTAKAPGTTTQSGPLPKPVGLARRYLTVTAELYTKINT